MDWFSLETDIKKLVANMLEPLRGKIDKNDYKNEQTTILTRALENRVEQVEFGFETAKRET